MITDHDQSPTVLAFRNGPDAWRIDWFGNVAFPDRIARRKQPSIFVQFSRVLDIASLGDPSSLLDPKTTDNVQYQRGSWVSIGTLPLLRVGDIWQDQRLLMRPDYQLGSFANLHIDGSTTKLIKAGLNPNEQGFLLPLGEHPWHRRSTQSYCLEVTLPDARRIIIPCVELIRFYFGSSSGLLSKLFLPPLSRNQLYENARFDRAHKHLSIDLASRISGSSAADIGRLHLSPHAWRSALMVGTSLLKGAAFGQEIHPQGFFPFEGKTDLVTAGKWLPYAGTPNSTFVVFNLRSCSHPFPFKSLKYEIKDRDQYAAKLRAAETGQGAKHRKGSLDSSNKNITEQDPSGRLVNKTWAFRTEPRFPDLIDKPIWKSKVLASSDADFDRIGGGFSMVDAAAIDAPGSEHRVRSIDLALALASEQPPPEFLREFIEELKCNHESAIRLLTASQEDGWTVPVPLIYDDDGEIDHRLFFDINHQHPRLRRISVLLIMGVETQTMMVIIEATPPFQFNFSTFKIDRHSTFQAIQTTIIHFLTLKDSNDQTTT
jgi:hypothetical protein